MPRHSIQCLGKQSSLSSKPRQTSPISASIRSSSVVRSRGLPTSAEVEVKVFMREVGSVVLVGSLPQLTLERLGIHHNFPPPHGSYNNRDRITVDTTMIES
ncbi:hypothetical protein TNCV_2078491 [Trichonephila clavipes]|nr:hypothetical protein TNCV_2078491 [Trichonephila clavipes]